MFYPIKAIAEINMDAWERVKIIPHFCERRTEEKKLNPCFYGTEKSNVIVEQ